MADERIISDALGVVLGRGFRIRLYRHLTDGISPGLDEVTYPVLSSIARSTGPTGAREIAEDVGTDRSVVSRRAATLVTAGLVQTVRVADGRLVQFELTGAGIAAVERMRRRLDAAIADHIEEWSDVDRSTFAKLLNRFSSHPLAVGSDALEHSSTRSARSE